MTSATSGAATSSVVILRSGTRTRPARTPQAVAHEVDVDSLPVAEQAEVDARDEVRRASSGRRPGGCTSRAASRAPRRTRRAPTLPSVQCANATSSAMGLRRSRGHREGRPRFARARERDDTRERRAMAHARKSERSRRATACRLFSSVPSCHLPASVPLRREVDARARRRRCDVGLRRPSTKVCRWPPSLGTRATRVGREEVDVRRRRWRCRPPCRTPRRASPGSPFAFDGLEDLRARSASRRSVSSACTLAACVGALDEDARVRAASWSTRRWRRRRTCSPRCRSTLQYTWSLSTAMQSAPLKPPASACGAPPFLLCLDDAAAEDPVHVRVVDGDALDDRERARRDDGRLAAVLVLAGQAARLVDLRRPVHVGVVDRDARVGREGGAGAGVDGHRRCRRAWGCARRSPSSSSTQ